jgi:hypothetical protein
MLTFIKVAAASAVMGLAVSWLHPHITTWLGSSLAGKVLGLAGVIGIGLGLYAAMVSQLRIPEFQELVSHVRRKLAL